MQKEWVFDQSMTTGVVEIDAQHRNLVSLLNDACKVLAGNPNPRLIKSLVSELLSYAIYHFRTEEELMQAYGYFARDHDAAERHVAVHREFANRVVELNESLRRGADVEPDAVVAFLGDWVREHIQGTDRDLAEHILRERAGRDAGSSWLPGARPAD